MQRRRSAGAQLRSDEERVEPEVEQLLLPHLHLVLVVDVDAHVAAERRAVRQTNRDAG